MSRRYTRESAMRTLFQIEVGKNNPEDALGYLRNKMENKVSQQDMEYLEDIINITMDNQDKIDEIIDLHTENWSIERLSKVDLSILRLALAELLYVEDIPYKVSINEAVELAKKYSTHESPSYVNGVLDKAFKSLQGDKK
ncbi:transcription antitermination factor NusB [Natranaerofaba carboxydovora]|uniref:transcription antitermination factor NusB n=1 Tax=Natranaerofaba carboxydovora TaxID=2742683 RepID=UPI001F139AD8|nr:transcription antitermination factor NusB [Natranaerofaba carboxydovora]UMZ73952.1 N utilization substance protein B [Natranaerofaba carboxydovora]